MSFSTGVAHNGRRVSLQSSIYTGEVGVRERAGGRLELAWFGPQPTLRGTITGQLDGAAVRITGVRARALSSDAMTHASSRRAIVATAELVAARS
jgi:hypothetical protein